MGQPYIGEIRIFAGNFAPAGWLTCDGQTLAISEYSTLFNLVGTTYGGDGVSTFQLPRLTGSVPIHMGSARSGTSYSLGQQQLGQASVTLSQAQMPAHTHAIVADANSATTTSTSPAGAVYGATAGAKMFSTRTSSLQAMLPTILAMQGGSLPHDNMQPYQAVTYIISLNGVYPSPS